MFAISKELYEIDRLVILKKFEDMNKFFSITRNFSLKVHGHLKILVHLVNNLVESNDWLELLDASLKMPNLKNKDNSEKNTTTQITLIKENTNSKPDPKNEIFDKILSSFQNENKKLWDLVKKGEDDTKILKTYVEKIIDNTSQNPNQKYSHEIINNIDYPYHNRKSDIKITQNPNCTHNFPCNCKDSFLNNNSSYYNKREFINKNNNTISNENEYLRNEFEKLKEKLRVLNNSRKDDEDEFKNLFDEKMDQDNLIKDKNREIKRLRDVIEGMEEKVFNLEDEMEEMRNNFNRQKLFERKKSQRDILSRRTSVLGIGNDNDLRIKDEKIKVLKEKNLELKKRNRQLKKKSNFDEPGFEFFEKENVILKKDIESLKHLNNDLNNKNEQLVNIIEKNEKSKITTINKKYNPDLLKCIYVQAVHIEENENNQRSFYSQKY